MSTDTDREREDEPHEGDHGLKRAIRQARREVRWHGGGRIRILTEPQRLQVIRAPRRR